MIGGVGPHADPLLRRPRMSSGGGPATKKAKTDDRQARVDAHVDGRFQEYFDRLAQAVAIQGVSAWPHHRDQCGDMIRFYKANLEKLGAQTELDEPAVAARVGAAPARAGRGRRRAFKEQL